MWAEGPASRMVLWQQRHLLQTAAVDRMLGRLLDGLEDKGLYDEALIVVTADHGRAFQVGAAPRTPCAGNEGEILLVPLFIKLPLQRQGLVSDVDAQLTDVLPSVADVLGAEIPLPVDGVSLFQEFPPRPARTFFSRNIKRRSYPTAQLLRSRDRALQRNIDRFSLAASDADLFRFGPHRDWVGSRVEEVLELDAELDFELRDGAVEFEVGEGDSFLHSHVMGWLSGDTAARCGRVAIIVDGRIAAVPPVERFAGRLRFEAFVPEAMLSPGRHSLSLRGVVPGG